MITCLNFLVNMKETRNEMVLVGWLGAEIPKEA
jgi:hypothetical protein